MYPRFSFRLLTVGFLSTVTAVMLLGRPTDLWAKTIPSNACELLSASELQKTLGQSFGTPVKGTWPPPYPGIEAGTQCAYTATQGGNDRVSFIVYQDADAATARTTFEKLMTWFPAKSTLPRLGNRAYIDRNDAIHVLDGRVRFYISVDPSASDSQLAALAAAVIKRV